jgi:hypothetical protein
MKETTAPLVKVTDERKYHAKQKARKKPDDPMMGESFHGMYKRLEKEVGGVPFMPSYAYDYVDNKIARLSSTVEGGGFKYLKPDQKKRLKKELTEEIKYRDIALGN